MSKGIIWKSSECVATKNNSYYGEINEDGVLEIYRKYKKTGNIKLIDSVTPSMDWFIASICKDATAFGGEKGLTITEGQWSN